GLLVQCPGRPRAGKGRRVSPYVRSYVQKPVSSQRPALGPELARHRFMRRCTALERRAELGHLPLQPVKHGLTGGNGGLLASLRTAAVVGGPRYAQSQPRPFSGLARAYATRAPPALRTQPGALTALFGG